VDTLLFQQRGESEPPSSGIASNQSGEHTITREGILASCDFGPLLGRGGMAEVYLARHERSPGVFEPVVVKRLYPHLSKEDGFLRMFMDEARLMCCLDHCNIVKTHEVGQLDGQHCMVMEYLAGQPLHRVLRRVWAVQRLDVRFAIYIAMQVLDALQYAHEAADKYGRALALVHRDISPQNIFVTNNGFVKVLDFGIAKSKSHECHTALGLIKGKFAYLAPEQALGHKVDRRTDLFSLGIVLWEMLSGVRLFKAESEAATLRATLQSEIPALSKMRDGVPADLDAVLSRTLKRDPEMRYPNAAFMKEDLKRVLDGFGPSVDRIAIADLMREHFPDEIMSQRRAIYELTHRDSPPIVSHEEPLSQAYASVGSVQEQAPMPGIDGILADLSRSHRVVVRTGLAVLAAAFAAISLFAWYLLRSPGSAPPHLQSGETPALTHRQIQPVRPDSEVQGQAPVTSPVSTNERAMPEVSKSGEPSAATTTNDTGARSHAPLSPTRNRRATKTTHESVTQHYGI